MGNGSAQDKFADLNGYEILPFDLPVWAQFKVQQEILPSDTWQWPV